MDGEGGWMVGVQEEETSVSSICNSLETHAANKFITQQGCLVLTLILGPEQWVMNIFYDKWIMLTSEAFVGDICILRITSTTPGVWYEDAAKGMSLNSIPQDYF